MASAAASEIPVPTDLSGPNVLHLVVDMQRLFAEETAWHAPGLADILPGVARLVREGPARRLFARFVTPATADEAPGRWGAYYRRWDGMTGARLDPALLDLVAPLDALARPDELVDKPTYSVFAVAGVAERLEAGGVDTLVVSGVETDACVLASVLGAVDRGFHVVLPADAVASSSPAAHEATLRHLLPRLADQVELTTVEAVLRACRPARERFGTT